MAMVSRYTRGSIVSDCCVYEDDSKTMQQPKQTDKASDQCGKSNEAARKDGREKLKLPLRLSQKNDGSNKPEKSSHGIADVKDTNVAKLPKQPRPSKKSKVEKQKTRKHDVPSPPTNRIDESATGGKEPEKKSYSSPDSRNLMEVASRVVLKIRQHCQEGCVQQTRKSIESFQGVKSFDIDVDESQVKVIGTMKVEKLVSHLQKKLKREVVFVSMERIENETNECKGLLQKGKNIVAEASRGYGVEEEKVTKVVEEPYQVKNATDGRDAKVSTVMRASNKSKAVSKVHVDDLNELKNGNSDLSCHQHNSQYGSVGDNVHHLEKVVEVGAKEMHKEENASGGRDLRSQKASKKSEANSRVYSVNLDEQKKMNPDLSQNKTRPGINGDTIHHVDNLMGGKRQNKVTNLMKFGLYSDEEYLEKTRKMAKSFEGVKLAEIDASKGLIVVTAAVDQKRLQLYLKENLKRDVLVVPIWKNDITSHVLTNICGDNYGQANGDVDVVQQSQKLNDDGTRCGGDGYKHTGAAFGNVNGAWRKDKLREACIDINTDQQNYCGDSQFQWTLFSDENTGSCSIM